MKLKKKIAVGLIAAAMAIMQMIPVCAAEQAKVYLESSEGAGGEITVSLKADGNASATNGKFRIRYNAEELVLEQDGTKEALDGTMAEKNDCLTGNKQPGEIVVVFASAQPVSMKGTLFEMTFRKGEKFNTETGSEIQIAVEELASDGTEVSAEVQNKAVGSANDQGTTPENPDDGKDNDQNGADGENQNGTAGDDQNGASQGGNTEKGDGAAGTGDNTSGGSGGSAGGSSTSQSGKQNIKTGDQSSMVVPIVSAGAALVVIAGTAVYMIHSRKQK